jgi:hypothetical protein
VETTGWTPFCAGIVQRLIEALESMAASVDFKPATVTPMVFKRPADSTGDQNPRKPFRAKQPILSINGGVISISVGESFHRSFEDSNRGKDE